MVQPADPVRAALEEAKRRPLPPPEERARLMALAEEALNDPRRRLTIEEIMAELAVLRPAAE